MKHVMYGEKSLLIDDAAAETLIDYAAAVAESGGGDTVTLHVIGDAGNEVDAIFLLNSATPLIVESASATMTTRGNDEEVAWMRRKIESLRNPPPARAEVPDVLPDYDFDEIR